MPPPFRHRTTKKEPRCSPRPAAALQERTEKIMDRVQKAGDNQVGRVAALEEYLTLARAHEGETWFDAGAWTEDLALGARVPGQAPVAAGSRRLPRRRLDLCTGWHRVRRHRRPRRSLECLTTGLELALRTGDPKSALEQLRPARVLPVRARAPARRISGAGGPGRTGEHR